MYIMLTPCFSGFWLVCFCMDWIYSTVELNCWFHALDCFSYGFWTWKLNKLSSHVSFFCLPSLSTLFHFLTLPSFTSLPPLFYLSFTQGQRHEESAGFPAEEKWVPRKQPSREVRQIYEVSQVSGHFLTACACGCVSDGFLDLTTTGDDLALGRQICGQRWECACSLASIKWMGECVSKAGMPEGMLA